MEELLFKLGAALVVLLIIAMIALFVIAIWVNNNNTLDEKLMNTGLVIGGVLFIGGIFGFVGMDL